MKKMTTLVAVALAAAGIALSFGACSKKDSVTSASARTITGSTTKDSPAKGTKGSPARGRVTLTMGSWRADDAAQMNALLAEYKRVQPNVDILFRPTNPPDYNAMLRLQLEGNTGPDLMYARSYTTGQELFSAGYFGDCSDIPGVKQNFTASSSAPWQMPNGQYFAVPFAAVSHAVYYNKTIFQKEGLSIPRTWEDFLILCEILVSKNYTPLANGVADEWDILEVYFLGMLPNFIGGAEERIKYENGEKRLNDAAFVAAFQAMADSARYLPRGYQSITYNDSQALFNSQLAVMFMDGSWTAEVYASALFDWGVFVMPAPRGNNAAITFHPDMAITWNAKTKYPQECKDFLAWIANREGATIASSALPLGFFPMINFPVTLANTHANEFLNLNNGKKTDARFVWPKFMELYAPMNQAVIQVIKGEISPRQAADAMETAAARLR